MKQSLCMFLLLILFCKNGIGQTSIKIDTLSVTATILDKESSETIPYATIYNQTTEKGTISNLDGFFKLKNVSLNDKVVISFIGYNKLFLTITHTINLDTLFLQQKLELLDAVNVFADNSYLYELLSNCKKTETDKIQTAKTYFSLETHANDKQVEFLESYHNAEFSGYDVSELHLKNGRIALAAIDNRLFVSTETSRALYMHQLFKHNEYFAWSPLELNKKNLKKHYNLTLISKYEKSIYVIDFTPKENNGKFFEGKVWIDSSSNKILKLNLHLTNAVLHPFYSLNGDDSLTKVDLDISKTYKEIKGDMYVNSIDFNYQLQYKSSRSKPYTVKTNAVLYAYNFENRFTLPFFDFSESTNSKDADYRKIIAAPYNTLFWKNRDKFEMNDKYNKNQSFISDSATHDYQSTVLNNPYYKQGFFEAPYVSWSKNRIRFRKDFSDGIDFSKLQNTVPSQRYNLKVQLYLDLNMFNDTLRIITQTIFDPFSYYKYPITNKSTVFINIYFDLMEIKRRELENEILLNNINIDKATALYNEKMKEIEHFNKTFFKEVERGENKREIMKWNSYVKNNLGIDNVAIFGLYINE